MSLSNAALNALERERKTLLEDLQAIDVLLRRHGRLNGAETPVAEEKPPSAVKRRRQARTGLRKAILDIVANSPDGLKPAQVAALVSAKGIKVTGTTPLGTRVSNELWRMVKTGHVDVDGDLYGPVGSINEAVRRIDEALKKGRPG